MDAGNLVGAVASVYKWRPPPGWAHVAQSRHVENNGNDPFRNAHLFVILRHAKLGAVVHFCALIGIPSHLVTLCGIGQNGAKVEKATEPDVLDSYCNIFDTKMPPPRWDPLGAKPARR